MGDINKKDRGVLPRYVRLWVLQKFGEEGVKRVTKHLSPASMEMFCKPVPHEWYPVEQVKELFDTIAVEFPQSLDSLGSFIAEQSLKGFLTYLVRLVSMDQVLARLGVIWKRYHYGGEIFSEITSIEGSSKQGILTIKDYDAGPNWCALMDSFIKTFVEFTGARNVSVRKHTCIHKGDAVCSWKIGWEE